MKNFYKLNKDYIRTFQLRVLNRYKANDKRSETSFFKSLLEELNELFRKFGGRLSSKRDIPAATDYPDSDVYNKLINDISFDIDKIYNAQKIVESDVNNLINFDSNQRHKIFENLVAAQQEVYSAYTKSKRDVLGGVEIPAGNPFTSSDNKSSDSEDVYIDETNKILTLGFDPPQSFKNVDIKNTVIYFAGKLPDENEKVYPAGGTLGVGSHWKKASTDPHFINSDVPSDVETYKTMMIDDPDSNIGVGFCEFEAVRTRIHDGAIDILKTYIGERYGKDPELIYADKINSLQGQYISSGQPSEAPTDSTPKYKLVIPFTSEVLTNEIAIDLAGNGGGFIPRINWSESKVFSKINGADVAYALVPPANPDDTPSNGLYNCRIVNFVYPTRMELILEYKTDSSMWFPIDFYMSHYVYSAEKMYEMPCNNSDSKLNVVLKKSYDIFVDAEANETKEKTRALNVLLKSSDRRS